MKDEEILEKVVNSSEIKNDEIVLEVGSGEGDLSKKILEKNPRELICVEIDSRFKIYDDRISFIQGNILEEIEDITFDNFVANIPYHISEPLLIKLILRRTKKINMVCGKKFADALFGDSIIGLITRFSYDIVLVETISPEKFIPPPKVNSALVTLRYKKESDIFLTFYEHQKQKVKNYILTISEGKKTKNEVKLLSETIADLLDKNLYTLNLEEYKQLYNFINNNLL